MAPFELGSVVEVFGLPRPELDVPWYDLRVCSLERGPMRAVGGFTLTAEHGLGAFASADTWRPCRCWRRASRRSRRSVRPSASRAR
ncbi:MULTISPECIES: hypothetical protein [unclassified Spirillospora]|uniref:hypothetical protein n=1 Tax=unclassified Spirillospora TaxID=2642701 RepID=UPI003716BFBA